MPIDILLSSNDTETKRMEKISELKNEIQNLELNFNTILKKYKFDVNTLLKKKEQIEERVQCPFNKNHFVTRKNYEKHYKRCELISRGINTKLSLPRPPSSQFFYTNTNTISLLRQVESDNIINGNDKLEIKDTYESNNNLPPHEIKKYKNDKHIICNIKDGKISGYELGDQTIEERLNEHINDVFLGSQIKNKYIKEKKILENFDEIMEIVEERKAHMEVSKKSKAQLYAEQRDYKRRRKSYRAKNIRITKRTPTQIQKDIIDSFVKNYELYLEVEKDLRRKEKRKKT
ncbi:hypothetical protein LY90DRAFT_665821 [Neocallimastix californiae]|uniref:CHHC U11-48K-type domain-containing protein n=1 Tax=Neocallimastix californiae TaxID=1754190 RepID=A0A1Y2EXH7_9FUNG|nr:hypothetical protein LY90DRAFT_665821 [Neocallimastix californiae]|eukprot:ORY75515.1 hypothetical protein LY90DRAFT_665821 [Neocallimastix californiae]